MTSSVPKLLTTKVISSSLHEQIAQELARHFLVHLRAELAKPEAVLNNMSVFGRSGREVIDHLHADLLALFPSCDFALVPPENIFRRWVDLAGRFNYDSTAFTVYDLIFFERILDLKENSTASRNRFLERTRELFLATPDYRAARAASC